MSLMLQGAGGTSGASELGATRQNRTAVPVMSGGFQRLNTPIDDGSYSGGEPFSWLAQAEARGKRNVDKMVGKAAIDTTSSYDKAMQRNERKMAARGINAGSGIFAGKTDEWALARAAAEAGARNRARTEGENQNNSLMERLLALKMSQYNKNRDFNYNNNQTSNIPTVVTGGAARNQAKRETRQKAIDDTASFNAFTKAYDYATKAGGGGGVSAGNVVKQAINTNSPTNGKAKSTPAQQSVYLGNSQQWRPNATGMNSFGDNDPLAF